MTEDQILWGLVGVLMFLFCCNCGLLLYFCRYLRARGVADISFTATIVMAVSGHIQDLYKAFSATHGQEYGKTITKTLIIWQISSVALIFVLPILLTILM